VSTYEIIHDLAASQLGLVTYDQLREATLSHDVVRTLRDRSALLRVLPRVYAVAGSADSDDRRLLAAVLACGPDSFISHESGARVCDLTLPAHAGDDLVHITTRYERCPRSTA
jgi:DNA-binding NarL/FixJ family response regulator